MIHSYLIEFGFHFQLNYFIDHYLISIINATKIISFIYTQLFWKLSDVWFMFKFAKNVIF